jgi:hypothetical protein
VTTDHRDGAELRRPVRVGPIRRACDDDAAFLIEVFDLFHILEYEGAQQRVVWQLRTTHSLLPLSANNAQVIGATGEPVSPRRIVVPRKRNDPAK